MKREESHHLRKSNRSACGKSPVALLCGRSDLASLNFATLDFVDSLRATVENNALLPAKCALIRSLALTRSNVTAQGLRPLLWEH